MTNKRSREKRLRVVRNGEGRNNTVVGVGERNRKGWRKKKKTREQISAE